MFMKLGSEISFSFLRDAMQGVTYKKFGVFFWVEGGRRGGGGEAFGFGLVLGKRLANSLMHVKAIGFEFEGVTSYNPSHWVGLLRQTEDIVEESLEIEKRRRFRKEQNRRKRKIRFITQ